MSVNVELVSLKLTRGATFSCSRNPNMLETPHAAGG